LSSIKENTDYLSLSQALQDNLLEISEIGNNGSVPEVAVINNSDKLILLLDGEELIGAKQNRVVNTTILLKKESKTIIPVSCTEQGRWAYESHNFEDSRVVMPQNIRALKTSAVSLSLNLGNKFNADQIGIWEEIDKMLCKAGVESHTSAMRDIYRAKENDLDDYLKSFSCLIDQIGILVFINGKLAGLDLLSLHSAYNRIHSKILTSYALDAIVKPNKTYSKDSLNEANNFLEEIISAKVSIHKSVGKGEDYRITNQKLVGSALVFDNEVVDFPRKNGYGVKHVLSSSQIEPDSCILSLNDDVYGYKTFQYTQISSVSHPFL